MRERFGPFFSKHGYAMDDEIVSDEAIGFSQLDYRKGNLLVHVTVINHWEYERPYLNLVFVELPCSSELDCVPMWRILRDHGRKDAEVYGFNSFSEFGTVCRAAVHDLETHGLLVIQGHPDILEGHRQSHSYSWGIHD